MKLEFTLFGVEVSIKKPGYSFVISSRTLDDEYGSQSWGEAFSYLGARFQAWRLARMYAELEGIDQNFVVYAGTETEEIDVTRPLCLRVVRVTKHVAFFSK